MGYAVISILCAFLGFVILYFVIKWAVRAGVKEAHTDINKEGRKNG